ncbi:MULTISPECIES: acetylglutamate kinase [Paenibacillus]|uniref:Acetylglutamate kinase n=1 Tax=Paenibacillus cucumis (ex Kampfer et al. 2016) TaxID=1776858 RepID=A0ABS7KF36_9BACL|nr:acetylglutamate kinase [Paenibacillus cucumis (ex Kampfer et al. 2016)]MBY0202572.1 acetylglutamate kinase [Paenibacillus cucumis (ex Kampfer et al. 2016)]
MFNYVPTYYYPTFRKTDSLQCTTASVDLNRKLRSLWEQHVFWTRLTVNSIVDGLGDVQPTTARLLRNPSDFAQVLAPIYGTAIAGQFEKLLREHLTIAAELVTDLKSGNSTAAADAQKRWYANADEIATFLAQINPYWSKVEWQRMMYEHLRLLTEEVGSRIAKDYVRNVELSDSIEPQALGMADMMTSGIVQQFPSVFQY